MTPSMSGDHTHIRPWRHIERRKSRQIRVGSVLVGGDAPISVQTMTNTPTSDAAATIDQIRQLEEAGADIVRVSCPDEDSTAAFRQIAREADSVKACLTVAGHTSRTGNEVYNDRLSLQRAAAVQKQLENLSFNSGNWDSKVNKPLENHVFTRFKPVKTAYRPTITLPRRDG